MPTPIRRDRFVTVAISAMIIVLMGAFLATWFWWQQNHPARILPEYAALAPLVVSTDAYSLSARIALQSGSGEADWVKKNDAALRRVLQTALMTLDPQQVHGPGGLVALQVRLLKTIHEQLSTDKIEQLLLTDFILQTDT
jgi:flagellar basal body-associated protein FliL